MGELRKLERGIVIVEEDETTKENNGNIVLKVRRQWDTKLELKNKISREDVLDNRGSGM